MTGLEQRKVGSLSLLLNGGGGHGGSGSSLGFVCYGYNSDGKHSSMYDIYTEVIL